jgi:hypothetical protein
MSDIIIKSLLLLFFRKEEPSFLKERSKELLSLQLGLPAGPAAREHITIGGVVVDVRVVAVNFGDAAWFGF